MKRLIMLACFAVGVSFTGQAQKVKEGPKPNVNKAINYLNQGKYDDAKVIADEVPNHTKTSEDARSWYGRALVYAVMDTSTAYTGSKDGLNQSASDSFKKAIALAGDKADGLSLMINTENLLINDAISRMNSKYLMTGDAFFKAEKFTEAVEQFEKGLNLKPDSSIYQYAGYAAYNGEDIDKCIEYIGKYIDMGGKNEQAIYLRVGSAFEYKKDYENSIVYARQALKMFPNNANIRKIELNALINLKRYEEAAENLKKSIEADPKDVESLFLMGALYEEMNNRGESAKYFEMAYQLDPKHLNSALAVAKIRDVEGYKKTKSEMDQLDYKKDKAKLEALDKTYLKQLEEALARWEKVSAIDANNEDVLGNLYILYGQLDMKAKKAAVISRMKANGMEVD